MSKIAFQKMATLCVLLYLCAFLLSCSPAKQGETAGGGSSGQSSEEELSAESVQQPVTGDWLVQRLQAEPDTLNPIVGTDAYESLVNGYIHESLVTRDERTLEFKPVLAQSWDESEDHLVYTFYLRKGIKWHNGSPFTAHDVVYSYERIMDPEVLAAHLRGYYQDIEKVEALDDYTVRFTFSRVFHLSFEIAGGITIVCKDAFDDGQNFNEHPVGRSPIGTGAYRFKEWVTGQEIVLERDPNYWGKERIGETAYVDSIIFRITPDATTALQQLRAGQLDMMTRILPIHWVRQLSEPSFTEEYNKFEFYVPSYSYIGWNTTRPFFADKRVRQAMTHLVDREKFVDKVLFGLAKVVSGPFFFQSPYTNPEIEPWPYDPRKAVALLEEAGWVDSDGDGIRDRDGTPFEFTFLIPVASKNAEKIGTLLKEELEKVGIIMDIRRLEWATFISDVQKKDFDAVTMAWSQPWSVDLYQIWHSESAEENGSNYISFKNEEADELIMELRRTFDKQRQIEICHRFHEIVHEEQPYTFMYCGAELMAVDKRFQDVETFRIRPGYDPTEWWAPREMQKYP